MERETRSKSCFVSNTSSFLRALLTLTSLLIVSGCFSTVNGERQPTPEVDLSPFVGTVVTLHGKFEIAGKIGPYIRTSAGQVYLMHEISHWRWRSNANMEGKNVRITGTLRFAHFERPITDEPADLPLDHFYFDEETSNIRLE